MKTLLIVSASLIIIAGGILLFSTPSKTLAPTPSDTSGTTGEEKQTEAPSPTPEAQAEMNKVPVNPTETSPAATAEPSMVDMMTAPTAQMKMVNVVATDYAYDVKEIRVKEGDTVMVHFMNNGGYHDWVIDEFNARSEKIKEGQMSMVTFVANKKGTFEYYCSVGSHRAHGMVGKLIVE